ncbi:hypothetical protein ACG33_11080 [Steroidobacter denitrificans]|uniref:Regulator SirB n=1 Tax=Steroidobacter denitrificans TaxID=465721 RepID=A0A127FB45_STEDE|nr:hypothetical protein ACG33_11080 [Steroidobacter denitrificans]
MIEFYPHIRSVHIASILASGALFLVRGAALQAGARWVMVAPLRYLSYAIDTVLLASAIVLCVILGQYPIAQDWLTAKVVLMLAYIVLGSYGLKRGRTRATRMGFWLAALAVYALIISIARTRNPLGVFAM